MEKDTEKQPHDDSPFEDIPFLNNLLNKVTRKYNYVIMLPTYILLIILLLNVAQLCLVCKILMNYRNKILF